MQFETQGLRLAYLDEPATERDRGEPVLLIHGFASSTKVNWVETGWVKLLAGDGRRVLAFDHRGHGGSDKPHDPPAYETPAMARDALALLDHLGIARADVIGYSMGARVAAYLALEAPERVRSVVFGGLGIHMVEGVGLPQSIADAIETEDPDSLADPTERMFRRFAEAGGNDLRALAACIRGSRQTLTPDEVGRIACPALVAVGTKDRVAGDPHRLAALLPRGQVLEITGRDHNPAVGDKIFKAGVLSFLAARP
ncbi:MAG TPA: alpha/beta hydrolase [Lichenihabitans sp.]|jgi:pimeloyl-ACP methyl ester carboxylesterase|nr:alpha/beta hydrolase [Lichenihabitans sp.]